MKINNFLITAPTLALGLISYSLCALAGQQTAVSGSGELTLDRVIAEPDIREPFSMLHWSQDGRRVAWMHLARSSNKAGSQLPQQEIWTMSSDSTGSDERAGSASQPVLLASATSVTNALRGSDTPVPPILEEGAPSGESPFLLRDFAWSPDGASVLLFGSQSIAWLNLSSGQRQTVVSSEEAIADASLSPDDQSISFIRGHLLCQVGAHGGPAQVLATPPHAGILEGESDWPYRNELNVARAYAWSPDSSRIAWLETDDRAVATYPLRSSKGEERRIVYPKPGGPLPIVRVFVRAIHSHLPVAIDLGSTTDFYIPRIVWLPDSRHLAIERLNRHQQVLDLYVADALTGKTHLLFTEKDNYWINLSNDLHFLRDGSFLWSSERSGFRHLYHYDAQGKQVAELTHGNWEVTRLDGVDETRQRIYFTATEASPVERQLYAVKLDGTAFTRLTHAAGTHEICLAPGSARFADIYSNRRMPPQLSILNPESVDFQADRSPSTSSVPLAPSAAATPLPPLQPVEFQPFTLHLGDKTHAFLIKPPDFDSAKKYPVILYLAGGPGEQLVRDRWTGASGLWLEYMARKGYLIFALDNHGTSGHGHFFEEPIHLRLGAQELIDQRDGLNYLQSLSYVDAKRIGVCGWGYGGYLAAYAMLDRPVTYRAGFAGAPIIDWRLYDAVFAERYLDDPVTHANGWRTSVALGDGGPRSFKGSLLVAQGTEDELVHLENLFTLQAGLVNAGKSADYLLFPGRGHTIDDAQARKLLFTRMTEFFLKNL
jgi:dipeptidyl-peptidase-4